ncbi:PREDICTED: mas-related G-protein coupled receptor member D-like [Chrysochloris asiatica]|uniref:Mas-related G-protein coupled receptor member D-like n=1 Tax=Chrysochloris asiatica TaxID=185453 RepID=A0A9B0TIM1_CHRAS|nr:PREDICTED: mas-related G-protein coupled receptor member D-like [Chrysochloris asiatica]
MAHVTQIFTLVHLPSTGMSQILNSSQIPELARNGTDAVYTLAFVVNVMAAFICVCGIVGNSLVVWLLAFSIQRNPFCVYVLNLAVADLLFLLCMGCVICLSVIFRANDTSAYEVVRRVKYFAYTASLSLLTAISAQRCLSVLFPIWYKVQRPRHTSTVVCTLLWVLSLLMNTLASYFCSHFRNSDREQCSTVDTVLGILILGVFTPLMTLSSLILFVRIKRSSQQWRRRPSRLLLVILASVVVFLIFSLPLGIYWFILYWFKLEQNVNLVYVSISRLSSAISSTANPIIYILVGRRRNLSWSRREAIGVMLDRALKEEPEGTGKETPSSGTNEVESESQLPTVSVRERPPTGVRPEEVSSPACPCRWGPRKRSGVRRAPR